MANTYVVLIDFTDQGIRAISESPNRAQDLTDRAKRAGVDIRSVYWTLGGHDGVLVAEAADDQAMTAMLLQLGKAGNVRTTTLRAYDAEEMQTILSRVG